MISPVLRRDITTRLFRQLHQNDDPDWYRASGSSFCYICGLQYREHPEDDEHPNYDYSTDKRLCNGDIVHL